MKKTVRKRFLRGLMVCVLCFFTAACGKEGDDPEQGLTLSGERFSLSGEGESVRVRVAAGNGEWKIVSVSARDGAQRIWGNVFDAAGNLLRDNVMLALDGPGRLESVWSDHGFRITRSGSDQLLVEVFENGSGDDFGFVVTLASGTRTRDITVTQGRSDGYVFERIEYVPVAESSARVWREGGRFSFSNHTGRVSGPLKYDPLQNHCESFTFVSEDPKAFSWMGETSVEVEVPDCVCEGELVFNGRTLPYRNETATFPARFSVDEAVVWIPAGESRCHFEVAYDEFRAVYRVFVRNRNTGAEKVFEGVYTSCRPTAFYRLVWDETGGAQAE